MNLSAVSLMCMSSQKTQAGREKSFSFSTEAKEEFQVTNCSSRYSEKWGRIQNRPLIWSLNMFTFHFQNKYKLHFYLTS